LASIRRTRRTTAGSHPVDQLMTLVDSLVKENKELKRQLASLEAKSSNASVTAAYRGLAAIARRVEIALAGSSPASRSARRKPVAKSHVARKPASPETQAKRLVALARARQARAAKKESAANE
jgi:hypothetical protein